MFMIGGALGALAAYIFPHVAPGLWALVALAGVFGGVMRSPFTGVIFALELTHRFDAVLPLIIGASAAYATSVLILKRSVLTEKISRHGHHLTREYDIDPLEVLFVGEVMETRVLTFHVDITVAEALHSISDTNPANVAFRRQMLYPLLDDHDRLTGIVTRTRLETAQHTGATDAPVYQLAITDPATTHPDETLRTVATRMAARQVDRMPVVDRDNPRRIIGLVSLTMLLAARLKDLREANEAEQVLRLRVVRPHLPPRPSARTRTSRDPAGTTQTIETTETTQTTETTSRTGTTGPRQR